MKYKIAFGQSANVLGSFRYAAKAFPCNKKLKTKFSANLIYTRSKICDRVLSIFIIDTSYYNALKPAFNRHLMCI